MEHIQSMPYNSAIDKVLQNYQNVALSTLQGPKNSQPPRWYERVKLEEEHTITMKGKEVLLNQSLKTVPVLPTSLPGNEQMEKYVEVMDPILHGSPFPVQQIPVLTPIDNSRSEKCETILENEQIACFIVGGEKRLCLPQILNSVLRDYSLRQINLVCDDLYIYCSRCSPEQLEILKVTGILPFSAPSCGLITKTDAERLCNTLLYSSEKHVYYGLELKKRKCQKENSFGVYHECFGKCKGVFFPELYNHPDAPSIECVECMNMYPPQKFIVHSHGGKENRTCHWGFDSANWRSYLMLSNSALNEEKYQDLLDEMKGRFDYRSRYKRKQGTTDENGNKRQKLQCKDVNEREAVVTSAWSEGHPTGHVQRPSAFRPWSPSDLKSLLPEQGTVLVHDGRGAPTFLSTGPPVLLNPERVVPHNASASSAAPNVALAPLSVQLGQHYSPKNSPSKDGPDSTKHLSPSYHGNEEQKCNYTDINLEYEIEAVRTILMKGQLDTRESRENLLRDLMMIHQKQEERLRNACQVLKEELESVKQSKRDKLRDSAEIKRRLRNDIEKMSAEHARKVSEMANSEKRHKKEFELLRFKQSESHEDLHLENVRLRAENEYLQEKLEALERQIREKKTNGSDHRDTESDRSTSPEAGSLVKKTAKESIAIKTES
ncbi:ski oncogene-like [Anneissia japonica]|uniref:ski oncogene-like n=1 Tax=Anneissia japonica TaxID=1529436 RepID=UPI0014257C53|nr:ski oncogene-like [Anneissia japonica]